MVNGSEIEIEMVRYGAGGNEYVWIGAIVVGQASGISCGRRVGGWDVFWIGKSLMSKNGCDTAAVCDIRCFHLRVAICGVHPCHPYVVVHDLQSYTLFAVVASENG